MSVNVLPTPGVLTTVMSPPCSRASFRAIAKPSPVPPNRRVVLPSACRNSSKMKSSDSRLDPDSRVGNRHRQPILTASGPDCHVPTAGELHGIPGEIEQDLMQPGRIGLYRRQRLRQLDRDLQPFRRCRRRQLIPYPREHHANIEGSRRQFHPPRFDLGDVEQVVDQRQQPVGAPRDLIDVGRLLDRQLPTQTVEEQMGVADDRIHRRPQLVTHRREELALQPARFLRRRDRLPQPAVRLLPRRHVARVDDDAADLRIAQPVRRHHLQPAPGSVAMPKPQLHRRTRRPRPQTGHERAPQLPAVFRMNQLDVGTPNQLGRWIPQNALGCRAHVLDGAVRRQHGRDIGGMLDQRHKAPPIEPGIGVRPRHGLRHHIYRFANGRRRHSRRRSRPLTTLHVRTFRHT